MRKNLVKQMLENAVTSAAATKTGGKARQSRHSGKGRDIYSRLADLYTRMETAYTACANKAGLTCADCSTNCCTSFFQHHTYVEWAYLWHGLQELPAQSLASVQKKARSYVEQARQSLALGKIPTTMCPLNDAGCCILYPWRLMICRMHGTRTSITLPDGEQRVFPGCVRFTMLPCVQEENALNPCPVLDRTPFYRQLAALELELLQKMPSPQPKVNLTLAEMLVLGPPDC